MAEAVAGGALWMRLVAANIRSQWQYRGSFALFTIGQFFASGVDVVAILLLFTRIDALAGWSAAEVALLYGMASTSFTFCDFVFGGLDALPLTIRSGRFDAYLLRPAGTLLQLSADAFALRRIGKLLQALPVLFIAAALVDHAWSAADALLLVVSIVSGAVLFGSIWTIGVTICFWVIDGREFTNAFTYGGNFLAAHPLDIYSAWLKRLVVFVIPIAFVNYLPAAAILDRELPLGLPGWVGYAGPAVALVTALAASAAWRNAVRHYRSTGS